MQNAYQLLKDTSVAGKKSECGKHERGLDCVLFFMHPQYLA